MGGYNSGRYRDHDAYSTVNQFHRLDIRQWKRKGVLKPRCVFKLFLENGHRYNPIKVEVSEHEVFIAYSYQYQENTEMIRYRVKLSWSPCHYGGVRPWFLCPAIGCGARVAILYGGKYFACRHCYHLVYPSQRENKCKRMMRKISKIKRCMGWGADAESYTKGRPKGMHWQTYDKLYDHYEILDSQARDEMIAYLGLD
jgi:hypothetical protein